ncbi:NTP transferase domain-containing protein [Haloplanus ruber]|uniref:NTP transferase domain-containing protein n=1 Tax=Haloplanus ruber TaxID=869892 RepID=A0ABD6CWC1_9EURY|nr:NTP transferase domain-containing protein [Haloplanus ruber]
MCGGAGTRLGGDTEKPLVPVAGTPMVDRVRAALATSRVERIHLAVSPLAPATRGHLRAAGARVIETPGEGYIADLDAALDRVEQPVLTVAADLPLVTGATINRVLAAAGDGADARSLTAAVPVALKRRLGVSVDTAFDHGDRRLAPAGVNVVAGIDDDIYERTDPRLAVNVNRRADLEVAEALS